MDSSIEVTSKTSKLARQFKVTPEELGFADLVAVGWEPEDAWACCIRKGATWNRQARKQALEDILAKPTVQDRIETTKSVLRRTQIDAIRNADDKDRQALLESATSKEEMLIDLQSALANQTVGSTEWIQTKKLIVDVTRMKNEEVKKEDNTIHHFLPVDYPRSCENCLLNPKNNKTLPK